MAEGTSRKLSQSAIPAIAKDPQQIAEIRDEVSHIPTSAKLHLGDCRNLDMIPDNSVHLVVTSPPYWTLKKYNEIDGQMGHIEDYQAFLDELDKVWAECKRVLVENGRIVIIVGDVCLSRKKFGRHKVVPLHADIQVRCEELGLDNLAPIVWHKISNASFEANSPGAFLGKPYEPNAVIKHDLEWILMIRKPGKYRSPDDVQRRLSVISESEFRSWFTQIWTIKGESTRKHPAPYPAEIAERLVRMFSFVGDTVLDPFNGTGSTMIAAMRSGRNSIGIDIDPDYVALAKKRLEKEIQNLPAEHELEVTLSLD